MTYRVAGRCGARRPESSVSRPAARDLRHAGQIEVRRRAAIAALAISVGMTFNGLNNGFGNPVLFLLCGGLLALLVAAEPPPLEFWTRVAPFLILVAAAHAWATSPLWAPGVVAGLTPHYVAPDLALSELLGAAGAVAAFLAGALLARRQGIFPLVLDWLLIFACANLLPTTWSCAGSRGSISPSISP